MRYFLFISGMMLLASCNRPFGELSSVSSHPAAVREHVLPEPHFETVLYHCSVSGRFFFRKFHLSGLLFIKNFPDRAATQVVFQNQMGLTYFNFGWQGDSFQVHYIVDQMNRPALIKTLRKDFEMVLFKNVDTASVQYFRDPSGNTIRRYDFWRAFVYYRQSGGGRLLSIDLADRKRKVVHIRFQPPPAPREPAENIYIDHLTANFKISLEKIKSNASGK